ncbi:MAG: gamma-glutamyl-gamma-aminobutyrate hydrolase family protein [Clostridia bacterium]|nr:gamma-glutamyl-gamma-aminobutyrate hydrolase family protein [Clostridia bacterium]
MKPLIGLMPLVDEERESLWMVPGYMDALKVAGANPIMLPLTDDADSIDQLVERCDGLMFTGGHDINPALYHQAPIAQLGAVSHERDKMEKMAFERAMALGKPMLGICRGLQLFNALLGGTLWQDLSSQHPSHVLHRQAPPYDQPIHSVQLAKGAPLELLLGSSELTVNSLHHQGIRDLAQGLIPMAWAEDGLIEAIYHPEHPFLWAVQWHPEFAWTADARQAKIMAHFAERCAALA